jgi:hypothetical protein
MWGFVIYRPCGQRRSYSPCANHFPIGPAFKKMGKTFSHAVRSSHIQCPSLRWSNLALPPGHMNPGRGSCILGATPRSGLNKTVLRSMHSIGTGVGLSFGQSVLTRPFIPLPHPHDSPTMPGNFLPTLKYVPKFGRRLRFRDTRTSPVMDLEGTSPIRTS